MRPKPIANVLADLMSRRGYARAQTVSSLAEVWQQVAGPQLAGFTQPGQVKRGVLEIRVTNSAIAQEIGFLKADLLSKLAAAQTSEVIKDLRCKVG